MHITWFKHLRELRVRVKNLYRKGFYVITENTKAISHTFSGALNRFKSFSDPHSHIYVCLTNASRSFETEDGCYDSRYSKYVHHI